MACAPSLGHFIDRREPSTCLELSRIIRISGKFLSGSNLYERCIIKGSWVSWTLKAWLRNYKLFYFGSFNHVGVMQDESLELLTK